MKYFAAALLACCAVAGAAHAQQVTTRTPGYIPPVAIYCPTTTANGSTYAVCNFGGGPSVAPLSSATGESSHVLKASAGSLYYLSVTTGATAGYVLIYNAVSAPSNGAVAPAFCYPVAANQFLSLSFSPASFSTGITAAFSSTGCFTQTLSATAFFAGGVI
jgi:hypothetical protein